MSATGVIRVAPTGSKASPNVRYAFNSNESVRRSCFTWDYLSAVTFRSEQRPSMSNGRRGLRWSRRRARGEQFYTDAS